MDAIVQATLNSVRAITENDVSRDISDSQSQHQARLAAILLAQTAPVKPATFLLSTAADSAGAGVTSDCDSSDVISSSTSDTNDDLSESSQGDVAEHAEWCVIVNGKSVLIWEYLGDELSDYIRMLHSSPPIAQPQNIITELRPWQKTGVAKLLKMARGPFHGGILGDEMGLGKTLQVICACEELRAERHAFVLIVATKSCISQWLDELYWGFEPSKRPRVKVLDDTTTTAYDLLSGGWDYVICTYQFLASRYRAFELYVNAYESLAEHSQAAANESDAFAKHRSWSKKRCVATLHADLYREADLPIILVLDESQMAKNSGTSTHQAIKSLHVKTTFMVTATPFANRWHDVYGAISLLPSSSHPFDTLPKFFRAFAASKTAQRTVMPTASKQNRLVKFLQATVVARPATLLQLENAEYHAVEFMIRDQSAVEVIAYLMTLFSEANRREDTQRGASERNAIYYATIAQQLAANKHMLSKRLAARVAAFAQKAAERMRAFVADFTSEQNGGSDTETVTRHNPALYRAVMQHLTVDPNLNEPMVDDDPMVIDEPHSIMEHADRGGNDSDGSVGSDSVSVDKVVRHETVTVDEDMPDADEHDIALNKSPDRKDWLAKIQALSIADVLSPRIQCVVDLLRTIKKDYPRDKMVVFSRFRKFLDLLERALASAAWVKASKASCLRFDGTVSDSLRAARRRQFAEATDASIMLITANTGGAGLNLTAASHVVLCEPWWRKSDEQQAAGRAHRLGQTKKVHVYNVMALDAVVDLSIRHSNSVKAVINDELMEMLRRTDEVSPLIPRQYKGYSAGD